MALTLFLAFLAAVTPLSFAQPSPDVQARITAAIGAAKNSTGDIDYTQFVNPFIGTGTFMIYAQFNMLNETRRQTTMVTSGELIRKDESTPN